MRHIYLAPRGSKPFCPPHLYASFMDASAVASTSTSGAVDQPFGPYLIGSYVGLMYVDMPPPYTSTRKR